MAGITFGNRKAFLNTDRGLSVGRVGFDPTRGLPPADKSAVLPRTPAYLSRARFGERQADGAAGKGGWRKQRLEPCDERLSRTVLRGRGGSNAYLLSGARSASVIDPFYNPFQSCTLVTPRGLVIDSVGGIMPVSWGEDRVRRWNRSLSYRICTLPITHSPSSLSMH